MRFRHGLILALAVVLAPAASAQAQEPAFKGTLNGATPKYTWESSGSGSPGGAESGVAHCAGGPFHCEYVLFNVEAAGELALTLASPEGAGEPSGVCGDSPCASYQDIDGNLFKSDATGAPQGESLTNGDAEAGEPDCSTSNASESCKLKVEPGYYVLEVSYYLALEAPMTGTAELLGVAAPVPSTPTEPPAQGEPQPQPSQPAQTQPQAKKKASAKQRRAACSKKAKKIKNKGKRKKALKRCKKIR